MSSSTSHIGLTKPAYNDVADIADINNNMDIIDNEIYALKQKFPSVPLGIAKGGTNSTTAEGARTQLGAASIIITANLGTISSLPVTKSVTGVTSDMKVCGYEIGTPSAFNSNLTITTDDGSVTVSGTMRSGSSTLRVRLTNNKDVTGS